MQREWDQEGHGGGANQWWGRRRALDGQLKAIRGGGGVGTLMPETAPSVAQLGTLDHMSCNSAGLALSSPEN